MTLESAPLLILIGAAASGVGSLIGIGGGIILVPLLVQFSGFEFSEAVGISLLMIIVNSTLVTLQRIDRGWIDLRTAIYLEPFCLAGGFISGLFAQYIPQNLLKIVFAGFCLIVIGLLLRKLIRPDSSEDSSPRETERASSVSPQPARGRFLLPLCGLLGSTFAGLIGVGGGALLVPLLHFFGRLNIKQAAGTSSFIIGTTAMGAALPYFLHSRIVYPAAFYVGCGALMGVSASALAFARMRSRTITLLFLLILIAIVLRMLFS